MFVSGMLLALVLSPRPTTEPPDCSPKKTVAPTGRAPADPGSAASLPVLNLDPLGGFLPTYTALIRPAPERVPITALVEARSHVVVARSLEGVGRIRSLELQRSRIENLLPLVRLQAVESIVAYDTAIDSLEGIEHLTTLEELDIRGTKVTSLEPLADMKQLRMLAINDTRVHDLAPLADKRCLEVLTARGVPVRKAGVLGRLENLRVLNLDDTRISDVRGISRLKGLRELSLARTKIRNVRALGRLTGLRRLSIAGTMVTDVRALHRLTNLEELDVTGTDLDMEKVDDLIDALPFTTIHTDVYRDVIEELEALERRTAAAMNRLREAEKLLALPDRRKEGLAMLRDVVRTLEGLGDFAASERQEAEELLAREISDAGDSGARPDRR